MCVIDPMYNLLLGTAKHMISVWKSQGYITDRDLHSIQETVDNFVTPNDVGRIPTRIASGLSGFTADQWRNRDYDCWLLFVKACHLRLIFYNTKGTGKCRLTFAGILSTI